MAFRIICLFLSLSLLFSACSEEKEAGAPKVTFTTGIGDNGFPTNVLQTIPLELGEVTAYIEFFNLQAGTYVFRTEVFDANGLSAGKGVINKSSNPDATDSDVVKGDILHAKNSLHRLVVVINITLNRNRPPGLWKLIVYQNSKQYIQTMEIVRQSRQ